MNQKTREILEADIRFISLCPRGKNGLQTLYKAETAMAHFEGITKAAPDFDEKGRLIACVWAPNIADSDGDYASPEAVEKMAHSYMKNAAKVDLIHNCDELPKEAAYVAESFIIQKGDERFAGMCDYEGNPVDVTGGWGVVMQIDDPELRKAYREGVWQGVSMYGPAKVRTDAKKAERIKGVLVSKNQRVLNALRSWFERDGTLEAVHIDSFMTFDRSELLTTVSTHLRTTMDMPEDAAMVVAAKFADTVLPKSKETNTMTKEQIEALKAENEALKAENEALKTASEEPATQVEEPATQVEEPVTQVEEPGMTVEQAMALAQERDAATAEEPEAETAEDEEVELADLTDEELLAYAAEQEIEVLKAATDFTDPKSVREFVAKRAEILKATGAPKKTTARKTVVRRRRSNVTVKAATEAPAEEQVQKMIASGKAAAAHINRMRGY